MFKKWRSYVSLLVCSCCILSMLSLNTLRVRADSSSFSLSSTVSFTYSNSHVYSQVSGYISGNSGGGGYISGGSGSINSISGGGGQISSSGTSNGSLVTHVKIPFTIRKSLSDLGLSDASTDSFIKLNTSVSSVSYTASGASRFTVSNIGIYDSKGKLLTAGSSSLTLPTDIVQLGKIVDSSNTVILNYIIEYDVECAGIINSFQAIPKITVTSSFAGSVSANVATTQEVNSSSTPVTDSKGHELQEKSNTIQEETKTTTNNIFDKISDFFGSFFENIKNALVSVFVPEDGYFSSWFNRLNTMLSDKLGILYFPFDYTISFLTELNSATYNYNDSKAVIVFPEVKFTNPVSHESFVIINKTNVRLVDYTFPIGSSENSSLVGSSIHLGTFRNICRTVTSIVLALFLLSLLRKKLNLIIRGSDYDS